MTEHDTQAALQAGTAMALPNLLNPATIPAFVVPDGYGIKMPDIDGYAPQPRRKMGKVRMADLDSLIAYTGNHRDAHTAIYVDPHNLNVTAVLNDHDPSKDVNTGAGHGDHRAILDLRHTPEWLSWTDRDGALTDQVDFAEFVEDNAKDVQSPDSATMLEIITTFQTKTDASYKSAVRLQSGALSVAYTEDISATAGQSGQLEIPSEFQIALAVFEGGPKYAVTARLRHRCSGGKLRLGFKLERLHDVLRYAISGEDNSIVPRLRRELADTPVYVGAS